MKLSLIFFSLSDGSSNSLFLELYQLRKVVLFSTSEGVGNNMLLGVPSYVYTFGQL